MPNGLRTSNGRTNRLVDEHSQFLQDQLVEAQQSLFFARSVREVKFLQSRIDYLKKVLKETNNKIKR